MSVTEPQFQFLCRYEARLDPRVHVIGQVPAGQRHTVLIEGGTVAGERLQGEVLPGGGDWALVDGSGILRLDVRATFATNDGAMIHVAYRGILRPYSRDLRQRLDTGELSEDDLYFRIAPRFETGAAAYGWLNGILAVGYGSLTPDGVAYDIFEIL